MGNTKIKIHCEKKENRYMEAFSKFYLSLFFPKIKEANLDCPDKNNQHKAPDYFLTELKIAVEVKEVHERGKMDRSAIRGKSVKKLQEALDKLLEQEESLKSIYYLGYPWYLKISKEQAEKVARNIIDEIKRNNKKFSIKKVGEFKVINTSQGEKPQVLLLGSIGPVISINPAGTIHQNIGPKIITADRQLGSLKASKKILLLVNQYIFGDRITDFVEALTYSYNDLLNSKNIDEIWLQMEKANGQFTHELLYSRDFLVSFDNKKIKPSDEQQKQLFKKWFYPLSKLGDDYKEKLFISLKKILEKKKPHQIFKNEFVYQEMVRLGIWLAEKERFKDAIWIIDKFIDYPDPEEPEKYSGDPEFNYHQQIINGEDPRIITTVLENLAWVIQKIAVNKKYIEKALDYTKKLLHHQNLCVKLQAIVVLIEIAARRQWLEGWGKKPREGQYEKFHRLVFDLVNLVSKNKNPNYKAIAECLCHVFAYYKDLSTKEAEQVLDALKISDKAAGLFVYFGIFRQRHYKDQNIEYNWQKLEEKLKEMIKSRKEDYQRLRASITWHLWEVLKENRDEFEITQQYIDLILKQPYQRDIYYYIEGIINDWIKGRSDICTRWYKQMLSKVSNFARNTEKLQPQGGVGLMYTEEIVETIAKYNPNELLEIMEKLVSFWEKGIFIGSPKRLFESYKLVSVESQRIEIKKKFQKWYNSMRKLNPKIEKVDWD